MQRTVEALVHPDGTIEPKEPMQGTSLRRALITIIEEPDDRLPDALERALTPLFTYDDAALWEAARSRMNPAAAERLQALNLKQQRDGLTAAEEIESDGLIQEYERAMLVRAQAAALLKERGHDISVLLVKL
jgi:hypothetical protein